MANGKKVGLTKKHWFGYMCGDWGGCMTFTLMSAIFPVMIAERGIPAICGIGSAH